MIFETKIEVSLAVMKLYLKQPWRFSVTLMIWPN